MPLGMRWNFHVSPSRMIVWPALLPPWKRMTMSDRSASRSVTFPFPSSPHWAPTITSPGMSGDYGRWASVERAEDAAGGVTVGARGRRALAEAAAGPLLPAAVIPEDRDQLAHLDEPRDDALADLLLELGLVLVRGHNQGL